MVEELRIAYRYLSVRGSAYEAGGTYLIYRGVRMIPSLALP